MPTYDGDIKLSVSLSPGDIKDSAKTLQEEIETIFDSTANTQLEEKFAKIEEKMSKVTAKAQQLATELESMEEYTPTAKYAELQTQLASYEDKIVEIKRELSDTDAMQISSPDHIEYLKSMLEEYTVGIQQTINSMTQLEEAGKAFTGGTESEEYKRKATQLAEVNNQMRVLIAQMYQLRQQEQVQPSPQGIFQVDFKKLLRNVMRYGLGIRSLYMLFAKLKQAVKEGVNNLARWNNGNNETNRVLTDFTSSLTQVKNSIGAAFAPILSVVVPSLTRMVSALNSAIQALGVFFAKLSGKSTYMKAVKQTKDYAKSLGGVGGAAKKAENNLADFDDIMVLTTEDASGGGSGVDYNTMFEEVAIDNTTGDWLTTVEEFGKNFGETLYNAFVDFDWGTITGALSIGIEGVFKFITGFIQGINWAQLPQDIWDAIMEFIRGIDLAGLFSTLSEMVGAIFAAVIQFFFIGIPTFLMNLVTEITTRVQEYFAPFIEQAEEMGGNIIDGVLLGISNIIKNIGTWIKDNIFQPFIDGFKKVFGIASPSTVMEEQGKNIMDGLLLGLLSLWEKFKKWWKDLKDKAVEIVTELRDKVVEKYNELRDKVEEIVRNLKENISTLFTNIKNKVVEIATNIKTKVVDVFDRMKEGIKNAWDGMWTNIKNVINSILGGVESLANGVVNAVNTIIRALNGLHFDIPDWIPVFGGKSFGFNLNTLSNVSIPRLAQGAVIPPNREFLAVMGDQRRGNNIEMPEELLRNIIRDELGTQNNTPNYAEMNLDGEVFARLIVPYVISELERRNYDVSILGV